MFNLQDQLTTIEKNRNTLNKLQQELDSVNSLLNEMNQKLSSFKKDTNLVLDKDIKAIEDNIDKLRLTKRNLILEIKSYGNIDSKYSYLISKKKDYILNSNNESSIEVINLLKELNSMQIEVKEIEEAYYQGELLRPLINNLKDSLDYCYSSNYFDESKLLKLASILEECLSKYYAELDDLYKCVDFSIDTAKITPILEYLQKDIIKNITDKKIYKKVLEELKTLDLNFSDIQNNLKEKYKLYNKKNDELDTLIESIIIDF